LEKESADWVLNFTNNSSTVTLILTEQDRVNKSLNCRNAGFNNSTASDGANFVCGIYIGLQCINPQCVYRIELNVYEATLTSNIRIN